MKNGDEQGRQRRSGQGGGREMGTLAEEGIKRVSKGKMWPTVLTTDEGSSQMRNRN